MARPVQSVLIVGRDAAAWLTALGLFRAFGPAGVTIRVLELPSILTKADVYATLPSQQALHRLLGIDEADILRVAKGVPVLGQRFANWSGAAPPFLHAYDTQGAPFSGVEFLHYWLRAREEGMNVALEDFSVGAAAAKQGRLAIFGPETATFSRATYGYHFDAQPYVRAVRSLAQRLGIERIEGQFAGAETTRDGIQKVLLVGGESVSADLYVDATGAEAALACRMPTDRFEDWGKCLPCNRMIAATAPRLSQLPGFSQVLAHAGGWIGIYPLQTRTAVQALYDSGVVSDSEMIDALPVLSRLSIEGDAVVSGLRTGIREAWQGNCVAIGGAASMLEPLDATSLHSVHIGISTLVSLFPVDAEKMPEARIYNTSLRGHAENLRDFQLAHYHLNRRFDSPFWNKVRDVPLPPGLASRLALFGARGRVLINDNETFQEENWLSILIGHGLIPRSWDQLAGKMPQAEQIGFFQRMLGFIAKEVSGMPSIEAHMELTAPASAPQSSF